jgi:hypothetical protein
MYICARLGKLEVMYICTRLGKLEVMYMCARLGKLEVMYMCARDITFASFCEYSIKIWNCSDSVVFFRF